MANKAIGQLTAKTTPASADVFALEDTEDTKKINYDALADAILNKITSKNYTVAGSSQTLINAINTLNSNISWRNVPSSVTTKALFQDYIDNQIATNGYFYGYMTSNVSVSVGLGNIGYYIFAEANSTNYRLVQAVSSDNNSKYTMLKLNATWQDWIPSNIIIAKDAFTSTAIGTSTSTSSGVDSLRTQGVYYVQGNDLPDGTNGHLIVLGTSNVCKQIFMPYRTPGYNDNHLYIRGWNSTEFGKWSKYDGTII